MILVKLVIGILISFLSLSTLNTYGEVIFDKSPSINVKTVSLKTFDVKNKKKAYLKVNKINPINYYIGAGKEEYMKKDGIFLKTFSPVFGVFNDHLFNNYFSFYLNAEIVPSSIIVKEGLNFSLKKSIFTYGLNIELGQKVNIKEQYNDGYFFLNTGILLNINLNNYSISSVISAPNSEYQDINFYIKLMMKDSDLNAFGFFFKKESFRMINEKEELNSHTNYLTGFIFQF